jgi:hypothetical protein
MSSATMVSDDDKGLNAFQKMKSVMDQLSNEIFSLHFQPNEIEIVSDVYIPGDVTSVPDIIQYRSKEQYLDHISKTNLPEVYNKVEILSYFLYDVVSSAYGCSHDFGDTKTAVITFDNNYKSFIKKYDKIKFEDEYPDIFEDAKSGCLLPDKPIKLRFEQLQGKIDSEIKKLGVSEFKYTSEQFKIKGSTGDNISYDEDIINVKKFFKISKTTNIIWVPDVTITWLNEISKKFYNTKITIAQIDGFQPSPSNSELITRDIPSNSITTIANFSVRLNQSQKYSIDVLFNDVIIAQSVSAISQPEIMNTVNDYLYNPSNPNEKPKLKTLRGGQDSAIGSLDISWNEAYVRDLPNKPELVMVLEYLKAAGDQTVIDICKECNNLVDPENPIFILTTIDKLAYYTACSIGVPACYNNNKQKEFDIYIPNSLSGSNNNNEILKNMFIYKIEQLYKLYTVYPQLWNIIEKIIENNTSLTTNIIWYIHFLEEINLFLKRINSNITILTTAFNKRNNIAEQLKYLNDDINKVNFSTLSIYNFISPSVEYDDDDDNESISFLLLQKLSNNNYIINVISDRMEESGKITTLFCDNKKFLENQVEKDRNFKPEKECKTLTDVNKEKCNCAEDLSANSIDGNVGEYIREKCSQIDKSDNRWQECVDSYTNPDNLYGLKLFTDEQLKETQMEEDTDDTLVITPKLNEIVNKWILVGTVVYYDVKKNKIIVPSSKVEINFDILEFVVNVNYPLILYSIPQGTFSTSIGIFNITDDEGHKRLKYLIKTLQISLNRLRTNVNHDDEAWNNTIIWKINLTLFEHARSLHTEQEQEEQEEQTKPSRNIPQENSQKTKKEFATYISEWFRVYETPKYIEAIVKSNNSEDFIKLNTTKLFKRSSVPDFKNMKLKHKFNEIETLPAIKVGFETMNELSKKRLDNTMDLNKEYQLKIDEWKTAEKNLTLFTKSNIESQLSSFSRERYPSLSTESNIEPQSSPSPHKRQRTQEDRGRDDGLQSEWEALTQKHQRTQGGKKPKKGGKKTRKAKRKN